MHQQDPHTRNRGKKRKAIDNNESDSSSASTEDVLEPGKKAEMEISESKDEFPLDRLPAVVIVKIACYLSIKDLAACCAVSRGVREAFDDELVWTPRYDRDRAKYLLQTPCKVIPGFVRPQIQNSSLSPVSKWRLAFMAEHHFWKNWRMGRCKEEEIIHKRNPDSRLESRLEKIQRLLSFREEQLQGYGNVLYLFLTNDYMIADISGRIEILDVRDYPATIVMEPIPRPKYVQHIIKRNNFILFLYNLAVQVFQLNFLTKQHNVHAFILDETEKLCNEKKDRFYDYVDNSRTITFKVVEPYFVGCLEGDSTIHIWNFETGVKLKTEKCPVENGTIQAIKSSYFNLIIAVNVKESNSSLFLLYDLLKTVFLPFRKTVHGSYEYCVFGDCLSIWADKKLNIYNYRNCKQILSNYFLDTYELKHVGNNIVFLQGSVLKLFSQATDGIEILRNGVKTFDVVCNKYVRMALKRITGISHIVIEVDSSSNSRKTLSYLSKLSHDRYHLNEYATRFIIMLSKPRYIYHLW